MTKREIESRINDLEAEKQTYIDFRDAFQGCSDNLTAQEDKMKEGALDLIAAPYKICGENFEDWVGKNASAAMRKRVTIENNMNQYDVEIKALLNEISEAITEIEKKIQELQEEIDRLWVEWASAPDDEPESDYLQ